MWDEMDLVWVNIIIEWDYFGFFVGFVWDEYPGELVLIGKLKEWIDVGGADKGLSTESSGVRGVVIE